MLCNIKEILQPFTGHPNMRFSDITLETDSIKGLMLNEVVPQNTDNDFYGVGENPAYLSTTIPLFQKAGARVNSIEDILNMQIYITNTIKLPKTKSTIEKDEIALSLPILEKEISLFPNLEVIMLMGDVSKKAFNSISKKASGKNCIPAMATYKIRQQEFYYGKIRIIPSYIMTGGNILIEKSKVEMAAEDIRKMLNIIGNKK